MVGGVNPGICHGTLACRHVAAGDIARQDERLGIVAVSRPVVPGVLFTAIGSGLPVSSWPGNPRRMGMNAACRKDQRERSAVDVVAGGTIKGVPRSSFWIANFRWINEAGAEAHPPLPSRPIRRLAVEVFALTAR